MAPARFFLLCAGSLVCEAGTGRALDGEEARPDERQDEGSGESPAGEDDRLAALSGERLPTRKRYDYSRFSNGPRRVPRPRGASLLRAQSLGLGTEDAVKHLMRAAPDPLAQKAAGSSAPRRLLWPVVNGRWGRGFGYTRKGRTDLRHNGVDIAAPEGAVIRAAAAGIVAYSDNGIKGLGNLVVIVHANGWTTYYAHNLRNTVQAGWRVKRGERIALVGATGIARGPHLHFEFRDNGSLRDPARLFVGVDSVQLNGPLVELNLSGNPGGGQEGSAGEPPTGSSTDEDAPALPQATREELPFEVGTPRAAMLFTRKTPLPGDCEAAGGALYRNLLWPVRGGELSRPFDVTNHPGVTIAAEVGSGVRAAADGLVVYSGDGVDGYGKAVFLLHRNGWVTVYGRNREVAVSAGDKVLRGAWIARVGDSGSGPGSGLYFELIENGVRRDPSGLFVNVPPAAIAER